MGPWVPAVPLIVGPFVAGGDRTMFVFFSRRADRVRVLYWDRDGYVLLTKRLEKGTYRPPWHAKEGRVIIEAAELLLVLEGIELRDASRRARWSPSSQVRALTTL